MCQACVKVYSFPSSVTTPPMPVLHPIHPQAKHSISSGIAGQLQDPEERRQTDYTGALKAACASQSEVVTFDRH